MNRFAWLLLILGGIVAGSSSVKADFPEYSGSPPYSFSIEEIPSGYNPLALSEPYWSEDFLVADVDDDGLLDYIFRSQTELYAYNHNGTLISNYPITIQNVSTITTNGGAKFGVADVDGDGVTEIVALNANDSTNPIYIYTASTGAFERKWPVSGLLTNQKIGYIVLVNLQGNGTQEAIIQTVDINAEGTIDYYINRSVIAIDLTNGDELWRLNQNNQYRPEDTYGYYENYWGVAHGPLVVADADFDGKDEILGGSFIDHNGSYTYLNYHYLNTWVSHYTDYVDHLDQISVGDYDPSKKGLEWIVLEEDDVGAQSYNTVLFSYADLQPVWKKMATSLWGLSPDFIKYPLDYRELEPQNIAVGNFDPTQSGVEFWNRSRVGRYNTPTISQHPWIYDNSGNLITHYRMDDDLPQAPIFNTLDNNEGVEMIWTIDWDGSDKEYIAAKARHVDGEIGVFDAMDISDVWYTSNDFPSIDSKMIYVADVAGDSREEVIVCDIAVTPPQIRIYWNTATNSNPPKMNKWFDPLYTRLKQNWNYYSPGSYTQPLPARLNMQAFLEGPYDPVAHAMTTVLSDSGFFPLQSPYSEDPSTADAIPANAVDWVLLQLRQTVSGAAVFSRSLILKSDGQIVDLDGASPVPLHVARGRYYLVLKHRNHLAIITAGLERLSPDSTTSVDFRSDSTVALNEGVKPLETGVYGLYAADGNAEGQIQNDDKNDIWWPDVGKGGYYAGDFNLDSQVQNDDKNDYWWPNVGKGSAVSPYN